MINRIKNYSFILLGLAIPLSISFTYILLSTLIFLFFLNKDYKNLKNLKKENWAIALLSIFILYLISLIDGQFNADTKEVLKRLSVWLCLPILISMQINNESYRKGVLAFLISVFFMVTMSVLNQFGLILHVFEYLPFLFKHSHPIELFPSVHLYNFHNILIAFSLIINFYLFKYSTKIQAYVIVLFSILLIFSLFSEAGRSGQLIFILFLLITSINLALRKRIESVFMILLLCSTLFLSYKYSPTFNNRVNELSYQLQNIQKSNDARLIFWNATIKKLLSKPEKNLFGYGTGSWRSEMNKSYDYFDSINKNHITPHNNFLYIFFERGVIGFFLLCWFFYAMYNKFKVRVNTYFFRNLVISFFALMFFDSYMLIFLVSISYIYLFVISTNYE